MIEEISFLFIVVLAKMVSKTWTCEGNFKFETKNFKRLQAQTTKNGKKLTVSLSRTHKGLEISR